MATNKQTSSNIRCSYYNFIILSLTILGSQASWENLLDEDPKVFFQIWSNISSSHDTDPQSPLATVDDNLLSMLPLSHCCGWVCSIRKAKLLTQPYKDNLQPTMLSTHIAFTQCSVDHNDVINNQQSLQPHPLLCKYLFNTTNISPP